MFTITNIKGLAVMSLVWLAFGIYLLPKGDVTNTVVAFAAGILTGPIAIWWELRRRRRTDR